MTPLEMIAIHWPVLAAEAVALGVIGTALIVLDDRMGHGGGD